MKRIVLVSAACFLFGCAAAPKKVQTSTKKPMVCKRGTRLVGHDGKLAREEYFEVAFPCGPAEVAKAVRAFGGGQ